jgi:hypothetical protein
MVNDVELSRERQFEKHSVFGIGFREARIRPASASAVVVPTDDVFHW